MNSTLNIENYYKVFQEINASVQSETKTDEVLHLIVKESTEALNAKGALLRILNLRTDQLEISAAYGLSKRYLSKGPASRHETITSLYKENKITIIKDIMSDARVQYPEEVEREKIKMILDVPLNIGNLMIGILRIYFREQREISEAEKRFLTSISELSACAISKAHMLETQKLKFDHLAVHLEKMAALGRMAAGIAHEINNPLAGILLFGSNMIKKVPQDGPLYEGLNIIIHETTRCKSIIQELLEFSREQEPKKVLANIHVTLEKALKVLENEFLLHHIVIKKNLKKNVQEILFDTNQIEQVFVNLLLNAIEAIGEKGEITIISFVNNNKNKLIIKIKDSGCGVLPENINKIFEPFYSTKAKGTGLGLSVSYRIINNHQGDIYVSSKPGKGTTFVIEFPLLTKH